MEELQLCSNFVIFNFCNLEFWSQQQCVIFSFCFKCRKLVSLHNKLRSIRLEWVTVVALQMLLNDKYKLNHCKEMGAEPGRRFLIQPAAKLEPVIVVFGFINNFQSMQKNKYKGIYTRTWINFNSYHNKTEFWWRRSYYKNEWRWCQLLAEILEALKTFFPPVSLCLTLCLNTC